MILLCGDVLQSRQTITVISVILWQTCVKQSVHNNGLTVQRLVGTPSFHTRSSRPIDMHWEHTRVQMPAPTTRSNIRSPRTRRYQRPSRVAERVRAMRGRGGGGGLSHQLMTIEQKL